MKINYAGIQVEFEPKDYFYLDYDRDGTFQLSIIGKNRHPIKLRNISRQQLQNLCMQVDKCTHQEREDAACTVVQSGLESFLAGL